MSPRIVLEAIDEYLERLTAFYGNGEEKEEWLKTWKEAAGGKKLPTQEDAYSDRVGGPRRLRTLYFIDT